MARPFWSGQIQISLVSFGVQLFAATEAKSEIHFHQISKKTGERVRHQKVSPGAGGDEELVEKDEVVKGYEYSKGEYVQIDPKEIANLRIPSRSTLDLQQFVDFEQLDPLYFEKPYFVTPANDSQAEAFAVVRKALAETGKAGLGKIAVSGREHLIAITAPEDDSQAGLMAYALRYAEELRKPQEYFADIKKPAIDKESLDLAKELIQRKTAKFEPEKFTDQYEAALREMVQAKLKHLPVAEEKKPVKRAKVINLMDALRASMKDAGTAKAPGRDAPAKSKPKSKVAVMPSRARGTAKRRRSA